MNLRVLMKTSYNGLPPNSCQALIRHVVQSSMTLNKTQILDKGQIMDSVKRSVVHPDHSSNQVALFNQYPGLLLTRCGASVAPTFHSATLFESRSYLFWLISWKHVCIFSNLA
ncbi:hypothetical protein ACE6H2_012603 [Prunus campanulata]